MSDAPVRCCISDRVGVHAYDCPTDHPSHYYACSNCGRSVQGSAMQLRRCETCVTAFLDGAACVFYDEVGPAPSSSQVRILLERFERRDPNLVDAELYKRFYEAHEKWLSEGIVLREFKGPSRG